MSKAQPTPGPWAVNPDVAQVDAFTKGDPTPICALLWPTVLRTEDETEANAHLIAAAPDLLEALSNAAYALQSIVDDSGGCDHDTGICYCPEIRFISEARAALAKARGES